MRTVRRLAALAALAAALDASACEREGRGGGQRRILVFAAASLSDALEELAAPFAAGTGVEPTFNFAGSNVLALQIEAAPVADVFVSADEGWMDRVERAGLLDPGTRRTVLSNRLVVVGPIDGEWRLEGPEGLAGPGVRHLALGDPDGVPAGRYARDWLEGVAIDGASLWSRLETRIVPAQDVRAALGLVEADPGTLGVVYASDARSSRRVEVLLEVPAGAGPEIRYAAAALRGRPDPEAARSFLGFLESDAARAVFEAHGFSPPPG